MTGARKTYIYIAVTPKRWRISRAYRTLEAMNNLTEYLQMGYALNGVHPGIGTHPNFVLNLQFASYEEKEQYENSILFPWLLQNLKKYAKRKQLKVII